VPRLIDFTNSTISNTTSGTEGAVLLDSNGSDNWSGLSFVTTSGLGHGIYITASGTHSFNSITFEGYGANGTTEAAVYNDSGGHVTINVTDGDTPTYRNGSGATTTVNNNVSVTLTGLVNPTEVRVYTANTTTELAGQEDVTTGSFAFSLQAGLVVDIRIYSVTYEPEFIEDFTIPSSAATIPVNQRFDRTYRNP
jgi:hypothetical protein